MLACLLACVHASLWHLTACLQSGNIEGREKRRDAAGRDINVLGAVNKDTITRGLRYSIATGNWGVQGATGIRPGVSQVSNSLHAACFPAVNHVTCTQDHTCSAVWDGMPAAHSRSLGLPDFLDSVIVLCSPADGQLWHVPAGAEQADICVHAVASQAHQLPHRARGQAGQAPPAAQLAGAHLTARNGSFAETRTCNSQ